MKLYDAEVSGNCYKVRLLATLLDVELELAPVNLATGGSRTDDYLALNPRGQIPTLVDGDAVIWDSQAILTHLARNHGPDWMPEATGDLVQVMQWLAVAENECLYGMARARAVKLFGRAWDLEQSQTLARAGLEVLNTHLASNDWLAAGRPTIADVACYPYVALAPEGEIPLAPYAFVVDWIGRIQALPGYVSMPGIQPAAELG